MSSETLEWLNANTLIGFTETRGTAWHHRAGTDNHFEGPIPVETVRERLFHWSAESRPLYVPNGDDGFTKIPGRKAIVRNDTDAVLGIHSEGYLIHQYSEWLIDNVESLLDAGLSIGSAGLLRGGAVAWLSVEVPKTFEIEGVQFRPSLMAHSSLDGTASSTYGRHVTNVVCDNTMAVAAKEHGGQRVRVRSTKHSKLNVIEARKALGLLFEVAQDFEDQVRALTAQSITDQQFDAIVASQFPIPYGDSQGHLRAATVAQKKREAVTSLYRTDRRVTPWTGNGFGVWQAFNTYAQHEASFRGDNRTERNMLRVINGDSDKADASILQRIVGG